MPIGFMNGMVMQYLVNVLKKKGSAHLWSGADTFCTMFSTGGLIKEKYTVTNDLCGKPICTMCNNVRNAKKDKTK